MYHLVLIQTEAQGNFLLQKHSDAFATCRTDAGPINSCESVNRKLHLELQPRSRLVTQCLPGMLSRHLRLPVSEPTAVPPPRPLTQPPPISDKGSSVLPGVRARYLGAPLPLPFLHMPLLPTPAATTLRLAATTCPLRYFGSFRTALPASAFVPEVRLTQQVGGVTWSAQPVACPSFAPTPARRLVTQREPFQRLCRSSSPRGGPLVTSLGRHNEASQTTPSFPSHGSGGREVQGQDPGRFGDR